MFQIYPTSVSQDPTTDLEPLKLVFDNDSFDVQEPILPVQQQSEFPRIFNLDRDHAFSADCFAEADSELVDDQGLVIATNVWGRDPDSGDFLQEVFKIHQN